MGDRNAKVRLVSLFAALVLAGCGGNGDEEPASGPELTEGEKVVVQTAEDDFDPVAIYRRDAPGVVTIESIFNRSRGEGGQGSGFVVNDRGEIATNAHVVTTGDKDDIRAAREVFVEFADGNRVPARVVGFDPNADVGLIKIDPEGLDLNPLRLAGNRDVAVGTPVAAIGSPFGQEQSLSVGVVSATNRSVESLTDFRIEGAIQTDAAINRGNSGGPLLNADGEVIGINQQIQSSSGGGEGVGFAVPVRAVRRAIRELREDGRVDYAFIGVTTQPLYPQLARRLDIDAETGALVAEVVDGGPADDAGIRGGDRELRFQGQEVRAGGDVIVSVDGQRLRGESDLSRIIGSKEPGETVELRVIRGGDRRTVRVELGRRPASVPD